MTMWIGLIGGLALLLVGGDLLVRGAVQAAARLGVSPLVIGLTVVGFGTSTPELVTSINAALIGSPGIAYGNIVGSNIANLLLILGLSALLFPIAVQSTVLKRDGYVMTGAVLAFAGLAFFGTMTAWIGALFLAFLAAYIYLAFRQESRQPAEHGAVFDKAEATQAADPALNPAGEPAMALWRSVLLAAAGLALLVVGGTLLVDGAVGLARSLAVSETVIGLTIVAVGTSMPELATSLVAGFRRQTDVALGNVLGSNIYNVLGIGGATALIAPSEVPERIVVLDNPIMIACTLLVMVMAFTGWRISRWEGAVLFSGYAAYLGWMVAVG